LDSVKELYLEMQPEHVLGSGKPLNAAEIPGDIL
jgi:hypothetical protein